MKGKIIGILEKAFSNDEFEKSHLESLFKINFEPDFKAWDIKDNRWIYTSFEIQAACYDNGYYNLHPYSGMKDKNGKKIYHSDILLLSEDHVEMTGAYRKYALVGFHQGTFMYGRGYHPLHMDTYLWLGVAMKAVEVIGNIYENIDLLEDE